MYHHLLLAGVKGRIQTREYENEEQVKKQITEIVAEKVKFISSKRLEEAD